MDDDQKEAVNTPKNQRTLRHREILFGDCTIVDKDLWDKRSAELVRRYREGLPLTRADTAEAKRLIRKDTPL